MSFTRRRGRPRINRSIGVSAGAEIAMAGDGWDRNVALFGGESLGEPVGDRLGDEYGSLFDSMGGDE